MDSPVYKEVQYLRGNKLILLLLLLPALIMMVTLVLQLSGFPMGDKPMSNLSLVVLCLLYIPTAVYVLWRVKMTIRIYPGKIEFGWNVPNATLNCIPFDEVVGWRMLRYKFVGYGYRLSALYGTVYNVSGDHGALILRTSGEKILLGTHHWEELEKALKQLKPLPEG